MRLRQYARVAARATLVPVPLVLAACAAFVPETSGEVSVGRPQVFSRERLLQERLGELLWLEDQLNKPVGSTIQGIRDYRMAAETIIDLQARLDLVARRQLRIDNDDDTLIRARQREIADLNHQLNVLRLQQELAAVKASPTPASGAGSGLPVNADLADIKEKLGKINTRLDQIESTLKPAAAVAKASGALFAEQDTRLRNPALAERASVQLTSKEQFEDEAAYRDNIRARQREKFLDDTHDLEGFGLYELKFDVALTPGAHTQRKAVVELILERTEHQDDAGSVKRFAVRVEEYVNSLILAQQDRLSAGRLGDLWKDRIITFIKSDQDVFRESQTSNFKANCAPSSSQTSAPDDRKRAYGLLKQRIEKNQILNPDESNDLPLIQLGQCTIARYVQERMNLIFKSKGMFSFNLVWHGDLLAGGNELRPLLKIEVIDPQAVIDNKKDAEGLHKIWVATIDPKEYAQNISDVASTNLIRQVSLGLQAFQGAAASASAAISSMKQEQEMLQAVKRQPLATSFRAGDTKFGWVLGPKFDIEKGKAWFSQTTSRYTFSASIVVPAWYDAVQFKACGYWIEPNGQRSSETLAPFGKDNGCDKPVRVNLPHTYRPLLNALLGSNQDLFVTPDIQLPPETRTAGGAILMRAMPATCAIAPDKSCEQTLVIEGRELWRNPAVYIGHQKADRVELLPSMRGLVATFRSLSLPPSAPGGGAKAQDLLISTSTGQDRLPGAVLIVPATAAGPAQPFAQPVQPYIEKAGNEPMPVGFAYAPGLFPKAYADIKGRMRVAGSPKWVDLPGEPSFSEGGLSYAVTDLAAFNLGNKTTDVEVDLLLRPAPGGEPVSVMVPGAGRITYFANASEHQVTYAPGATADFSKSQVFGDQQRQTLLKALNFAIPGNEALFMKAYPGLSDALAERGGTVQIALTEKENLPPIVVTAQRLQVGGKSFIQPKAAALANVDQAIVPLDEVQKSYTLSVLYRRGAGEWIPVQLSSGATLQVTGRKKASAPKAADKSVAKAGEGTS